MNKILWCLLAGLLAVGCHAEPGQGKAGASQVREPAVAGKFYPDDPVKLRAAIEGYLADAVTAETEKPLALIAPHAGIIYSGQIAADAYRQVQGRDYDVVVIIGANHTDPNFDKVSVYASGAFRTPLGTTSIDEEVARRLIAADRDFVFEPSVHREEHSVELQLVFVQVALPRAKIVPIVVGRPDLDLCERLGMAIAEAVKGRSALVVASSDLSHYPAYEGALKSDAAVLRAAVTLDPRQFQEAARKGLTRGIPKLSTCACGEAPIMAAMTAASAMGASRGVVVSSANSGDALVGEHNRVVGYGAVIFTTGSGGSDASVLDHLLPESVNGALTAADHTALLAYARRCISRMLETETTPLPRGFSPVCYRTQGAFVTLNKDGQLRGCIGHITGDEPLCRAVGQMALQAAFSDPRFQPVTADEVDDLEIEISALTQPRPIPGYQDIVIGRDGVIIHKGGRSAVFLPQVATEQGWSREEMLQQLCRKAGLARDDWRQGADFLTFQAEVFGEKEAK
jgi:hypothetical protein